MTQNKTLTDEAFESALNACILDTECMLEYDEATTRDIGRFMWQAAKRETAQEIAELQADNLRLRDALEESKNVLEIAMTDRDGNKFVYLNTRIGSMLSALDTLDKCNKALSSTPAQSLAEHDNEVIEKCVQTVAKYANLQPIAEEIRALKVTP